MLVFIVFGLIGLLIMFLSCLIKYRKMAYLISGYNEEDVADKDGLCNWVGGMLIWHGVITIITGAAIWRYPTIGLVVAIAFAVITIIVVTVVTAGSRKFKKQ